MAFWEVACVACWLSFLAALGLAAFFAGDFDLLAVPAYLAFDGTLEVAFLAFGI